MDNKQRRELVKALLACPSISNREKRNTILDDLSADIKHAIQWDNADVFHVTNIVKACAEHRKGLKELIDALEFYEGDSGPCQKVREILARIAPPGLLSDEKLDDLLTTIPKANISENELRQFYLDSLPSGFPDQPQAKTLWSILRHLQYIPRQPDDGTVAILIFIEYLALKTNNPEIAAKLRSWSDQIAPSLGADVKAIRKQAAAKLEPPPPSPQTAGDPPSLLVEIRPDATNRRADKTGLFNVKILLWQPGEELPLNLYNDDAPGQLADIPAIIDRILVDKVSHFVDDING